MESMNPFVTDDVTGNESKKKASVSDRVSISASDAEKIDCWIKQVQEASKGFLTVSRSDMVAFLTQRHPNELTQAEIKRLRSEHYNPVRYIQWMAPQIKAALQQGDRQRVAELQTELRNVELGWTSAINTTFSSDDSDEGAESAAEIPHLKRKKRTKIESKIMSTDADQIQPV